MTLLLTLLLGCGDKDDAPDTAVEADTDTDADSDTDTDTDADADADADTDVSGPGCADGTDTWRLALFDREDTAFCPSSTMPTLDQARPLCASGWAVCTATQAKARNDNADTDLLAFTATLDDGENCMVTNNPDHEKHDLRSDATRSDAPGTCPSDTTSGEVWGLQTSDGYHGQTTPWGNVGALCCR